MSPRLNIKPLIAFLLPLYIVVSPFSRLDASILVGAGDFYRFVVGAFGLGNRG